MGFLAGMPTRRGYSSGVRATLLTTTIKRSSTTAGSSTLISLWSFAAHQMDRFLGGLGFGRRAFAFHCHHNAIPVYQRQEIFHQDRHPRHRPGYSQVVGLPMRRVLTDRLGTL